MKTAIIYDQCGEVPIEFYVIEGDHSKFDQVYVNSCESAWDLQQELSLLFCDEFEESIDQASKEEFCEAIAEGAKLITCGFIP